MYKIHFVLLQWYDSLTSKSIESVKTDFFSYCKQFAVSILNPLQKGLFMQWKLNWHCSTCVWSALFWIYNLEQMNY